MIRFVPRQLPNSIFVIGAGGTGSRLIPLLAQFVKTITHGVSPRGTLIDPVIYVIDDDVVEHKNLARQNFVASDVGKHKAVVVAQRYSKAFGVNIVPVVWRVGLATAMPEGMTLDHSALRNSMVIMCVDSAEARRQILKYWARFVPGGTAPERTPFIVDAGNEDDFGQVRFFNLTYGSNKDRCVKELSNIPKMTPYVMDVHYIPMDVEFYETLQDNEGGSCADLDQTLAINALMATMIMGVVQNFYYVKPFPYYSMGISLRSGTTNSMITPAYLTDIHAQGSESYSFPGVIRTCMQLELGAYAKENMKMLKDMGLKFDGTPISPAATPVRAAKTAVEKDPPDSVVEAAPDSVVEAAPASRRRRPATRAAQAVPATPSLPAGLTAPPPLTPL